MLVVNLYGPPGSGKSTLQSNVFRLLKEQGVNAEMIPEYAKLLTREKRWDALACQPLIFGKILHELMILRDQVDAVVLDSPMLLCALYGERSSLNHPDAFSDAVAAFSGHFWSLDYMVGRIVPYATDGRRQGEDESREIANQCEDLLTRYGVRFQRVPGATETATQIVEEVLMKLKFASKLRSQK